MWGKINDLEIEAPSSFSSEDQVLGGYNTTLSGTKRRYIKAVKKIWTISYDILSVNDYDAIYAEFAKEIPTSMQESDTYSVFTIYDAVAGVTNENVHMDISSRSFLPGTNYLSTVEVTFTQV